MCKNNMSKNVWFVLIFVEIFLHKNDSNKSIFGEHFGRSKNDPKSIGICPESVINHLGIIETHHKIPFENQDKSTKSPNF